MTKIPEYMREGWRRAGPGKCRCPKCNETISTNALGRAAHKQSCEGWKEFFCAVRSDPESERSITP